MHPRSGSDRQHTSFLPNWRFVENNSCRNARLQVKNDLVLGASRWPVFTRPSLAAFHLTPEAWNQPIRKTGRRLSGNCAKGSKPGITICCISSVRASRPLFMNGRIVSWRTTPSRRIRATATHVANKAALRTLLPMFGTMRLVEIDASLIEAHLRKRLGQRRRVHRRAGVAELGIIKPTTVHQEFRVLRRIFSVAVKKKLCPANPCTAVEFPVRVKGLFRPHYMTWSEQLKIESTHQRTCDT